LFTLHLFKQRSREASYTFVVAIPARHFPPLDVHCMNVICHPPGGLWNALSSCEGERHPATQTWHDRGCVRPPTAAVFFRGAKERVVCLSFSVDWTGQKPRPQKRRCWRSLASYPCSAKRSPAGSICNATNTRRSTRRKP